MTIISVNLTDQNLRDLDELQSGLGFAGRSEAVRTALRMLLNERNERRRIEGKVEGVLIIIGDEEAGDEIGHINHQFPTLIRTQVHNHLSGQRCMNLFVMSGEGKRINDMIDKLQKIEKIHYLKFIQG